MPYDCDICEDTGYVTCDEFDPDSGQYMHGVGTQKCECTLDDEPFDERI